MSGKNDLNDAAINKKLQSLYAIADHWYVKHAIQAIIFNMLFLDGYVCCTEGLYPANKETLSDKSILSIILHSLFNICFCLIQISNRFFFTKALPTRVQSLIQHRFLLFRLPFLRSFSPYYHHSYNSTQLSSLAYLPHLPIIHFLHL